MDDSKLFDVSQNRVAEAKNLLGNGQLRLVVSKSHERQMLNNDPVGENIETQALIESHSAILIRHFNSGRIVSWNRAAQRLYGWSKKEAIGKSADNLLQTELPEPPRDIQAKLRRHGCWTGELVQKRKDGRKLLVASYWLLRQRSSNRDPMEILEVNYNVIDRKQPAQKAQETERLALVGTMAAVFAHEVANPLSGLSASLRFVESDLEKNNFDVPFLRATVQGAMREVDRLVSLLNEFRSLALPQSLDLKLTDLQEIIEEILTSEKLACRTAGITIETDFESLPLIKMDSAKMKQVVLNLCKNAIEAMREGGRLRVKVYRSDVMVVLEISDNGIGVPHGVNIFELFKTTKPCGSGLGLAVVQQIVSAHNGTINYTTEAGRGTTFKVWLPDPSQTM
ncbi:MAG TPA: ATP-binding protein [Candidatus Binatia bacterium]